MRSWFFRELARCLSAGHKRIFAGLLLLSACGLGVFRAADGTPPGQSTPDSTQFPQASQRKGNVGSLDRTESPPLLLEEGDTDNQLPEGSADNSRCEVCHLNLAGEELVVKHARAGVGCAKCHGQSDAHIADESWASGGNGTPPEVMYPRDKIASGCMSCHSAEQVFLKAEKHKPDAWLIAYEVKTCTECHGKHRLPLRKCKWR